MSKTGLAGQLERPGSRRDLLLEYGDLVARKRCNGCGGFIVRARENDYRRDDRKC